MKNQKLKPPGHLSAEAKKLWRSIVSNYEIDEPAGMVLTTTLEAMDRKDAARATLAAEGVIQTDRFGQKKPHPAIGIERDAAVTMYRGFRLLGFDQESRGESPKRY